MRRLVVAPSAFLLLTLAGCTGSSPIHSAGPSTSPGSVQPSPVRTLSGGPIPAHTISGGTVPAGAGRSIVTLTVTDGTTSVRVVAADLGSRLFEASTPAGERAVPRVVTTPNAVTVGIAGGGGPTDLTVRISRQARWAVVLSGGSTSADIDTRGARTGAISLTAGVSTAAVTTGALSGTVTLAVSGGASRLAVHVPAGTPARVAANGGAGTVTLFGHRYGGVSGGSVFTSPGWTSATNRLDLQASSGLGTVTVATP